VGVALPHKHLYDLMPIVNAYLEKEVDINISIGSDDPVHYKFFIPKSHFNSQVVCMLINEVVTDDIDDVQGEDDLYNHLPALIIDGGYKTLGKFKFAADQSIVGDDSDTEYAMLNVNEMVAAEINSYRPGFAEYQIDEMCAKKEIVRYIDDTGKPAEIDVCALRDKYLKEVSESLLTQLCNEYDNLLDIKTILVGGGTGSLYYPYIQAFCKEKRPYLADKVVLAGSQNFHGHECGPVRAIAVGLYKDMCMSI
jgi:hypothetical protein